MEGVIPGDTDPPQEMGDDSKEVSESEEHEVCLLVLSSLT